MFLSKKNFKPYSSSLMLESCLIQWLLLGSLIFLYQKLVELYVDCSLPLVLARDCLLNVLNLKTRICVIQVWFAKTCWTQILFLIWDTLIVNARHMLKRLNFYRCKIEKRSGFIISCQFFLCELLINPLVHYQYIIFISMTSMILQSCWIVSWDLISVWNLRSLNDTTKEVT